MKTLTLLICLVLAAASGWAQDNIGQAFLSGNGIQFITLFSIIISTILFGILGVLEGKELSAILSAIAGFILGKGIPTSSPGNGSSGSEGGSTADTASNPVPNRPAGN